MAQRNFDNFVLGQQDNQNAAQCQGKQCQAPLPRHHRPPFSELNKAVRIFNLPYTTSENEIYQFFNEYQVRHVKIELALFAHPKRSALVEFINKTEANRARIEKDGEIFYKRRIIISTLLLEKMCIIFF